MPLPPPPTTSQSGAPTSATLIQGPIAPIGVPATPRPMVQPIPTSRKFHGTTPAPAAYLGYATTYGASGFCNSSTGETYFLNNGGGSGGPSACATGTPSN